MNDAKFLKWVADRLCHHYGEGEVDFVQRLRKMSAENQTNSVPAPYDKSEESLDALLREFHGHIQDKFSISVDEISYTTIKTHGGVHVEQCNVFGEAL